VERKEALSRLNNNIGVTATAAVEEPPEAVSEETPTHPLDEQQLAWLGAHGLGGSTAADMRARQFVHRAEADVAGDASAAAWQCCDLLTAAQPPDESELFDESVLDCAAAANAARRAAAAAARAQLTDLGVVDEHLALEPSALLPSIHEMAFARHVGSTVAAGLQRPPAGSFGKEYQWPACVGASTPPPPDTTLAMLVISRYEEDVGWLLRRLPPRVDYHVVQLAGRLQEELPRTKQTVLPIAPAASAAAGEAAAAARGAAATTATGDATPAGDATAAAAAAAATAASSRPPVAGSRQAKKLAEQQAEEERARQCAEEEAMRRAMVGGGRPAASHAFLHYLHSAAANEELIELLKDPAEAAKRVLVQSADKAGADDSVQHTIVAALRRKAERVMDLFKRWDVDKSGTLDKKEFHRALKALQIPGSFADHSMIFEMWDADGGGMIEYGELLGAMHAGRRFDRLLVRKAGPPVPPVVLFATANPFEHNERFLDDLQLLLRAAVGGRPTPSFTPLGKWRCGERLIHCDPSGAPHDRRMLPIGAAWRAAFGLQRPMPLWLATTPGSQFAVSRDALLRPWPHARSHPAGPVDRDTALARAHAAAAFYRRALDESGVARREGGAPDPIAGHAFERLWRYVFVHDDPGNMEAVEEAALAKLSAYARSVRLGLRL
jgi:hypothetical protein